VTPKLGQKPALRVEDVRRGSAAAEAGIQRGDLILSIAGLTVGDPASFAAAIANKSGKTPLTILRSGEVIELSVELKPQ
jgi:S1-C subfamily serine protease